MKIVSTPAQLALPQAIGRSRGVHVSGIIRSIAAHMGVLKPEWVDDPDYIGDVREITDPVAILRISIGLAWEDYYLKRLIQLGVAKHPGEMHRDGIFMSPDGISKSPTVIHEVKATYKSIKTVGDFNGQWMWLAQGKCYCKGAGTRYARFHILHLCGDYKYPLQPQAICWDIEFTQQEIDENWALMRDYRDHMESR